MNLPSPTKDALYHQQTLISYIKESASKNNGLLSFAEFMHLALYAPGLGYYSAGMQKFGIEGDFVTAPEISSLFSYCLAAQCQQILKTLGSQASILEFGAGSGKMAGDVIVYLAKHQCLPTHYYILEVSAELKVRQQQYLSSRFPNLYSRFHWLSALPENFTGVIVANEVIDAMPVHLFKKAAKNEVLEGFIECKNASFKMIFDTPQSANLKETVYQLESELEEFSAGYTSEILLSLPAWINSLAKTLAQGVILLLDYGFPRYEYYHPSRSMGTLMCHYRHHAHSDPLAYIGLQDITAHVDFTALAMAAHTANLEVAGFTNQSAFLLNNGLLELAKESQTHHVAISQQIQTLTAPHEMGELFKVIALSKDIALQLQGFQQFCQLHRL